jgi:charged multivesicular body protein 2A
MTPAERLRKNQRMLDKAIRELDQTRVKLEKQEKTLIQQIKTSAKNGQMGACKIQAKDLVRTRRYVEKFYSMRSQLQKISLRLQVTNGCVLNGDRTKTDWQCYRHTERTKI